MEKIYRVFISSTYEDLQEERKKVTQALLGIDCVPTGMEVFQASDDVDTVQFTLKQRKAIHKWNMNMHLRLGSL